MRFEQLGSAAAESAPGTGEAAGTAAGVDGPADPKPGAPAAASLAGGPPVPPSRYTVLPGQRTRANSLDVAALPPAAPRQGAVAPGVDAGAPAFGIGAPGDVYAAEAAAAIDAADGPEAGGRTAAATAMPAPAAPEAPAFPAPPAGQEPEAQDSWPAPHRQIALFVRVLCLLIVAVLLGHRYIPDVMGFGSLLDTFLPWSFVPLALLLPASLVSRNKWVIAVAALSVAVWGVDFGPQFASSPPGGPHDLRILSQNVSARDPDLAGIAALALAQNADIVVLQGMSTADLQAADKAVPAAYPHHVSMYEFAVWSKYPLLQSQPIGLAAAAPDAQTAVEAPSSGSFGGLLKLKVQVSASHEFSLYAVHLPQPSLSHLGFGRKRSEALDRLADQIHAEYDKQLLVVGDLDLAQTDRGMQQLVGGGTGLVSAQAESGSGFGFTWPSSFPMVRLDDLLARGVTPVRSVVLPAVGAPSAHRPIEVDLRF